MPNVLFLFWRSQGLFRPSTDFFSAVVNAHRRDFTGAPAEERIRAATLGADIVRGVRCMGLSAAGRPVVLIVEDEFLLRMNAVDMIRAAGFEAVEAANAEEAIEILETRSDITVVFTDIQMP